MITEDVLECNKTRPLMLLQKTQIRNTRNMDKVHESARILCSSEADEFRTISNHNTMVNLTPCPHAITTGTETNCSY